MPSPRRTPSEIEISAWPIDGRGDEQEQDGEVGADHVRDLIADSSWTVAGAPGRPEA